MQTGLFPSSQISDRKPVGHATTFHDNMELPVHRWFRYPAGFSAEWVREVLSCAQARTLQHVLDPFAGSGTVLLEAETCGAHAIGLETHPFVLRVARAKLSWAANRSEFLDFGLSVLKESASFVGDTGEQPPLLTKCYPQETLSRLIAIREAWRAVADGSAISELIWLALVSILRECSPVGTAQWQYVLPKKSKQQVRDPRKAFEMRVNLMADDMRRQAAISSHGPTRMIGTDARACDGLEVGWADYVITSPPYANNFDYADSTRLEMTFMGEIRGWGDLQDAVRRHLIRSCSQHASVDEKSITILMDSPLLDPIRSELLPVYDELREAKSKHGGEKDYDLMVLAYFHDMAEVWHSLRRVTASGATICFVIGDSAPYGVHVPVEKWLARLALAAGFRSDSFQKIRDRNVKWRNRKHTVPLQEGYLWLRG